LLNSHPSAEGPKDVLNSKVPALNFGALRHVKEYTVQKTTTLTGDQLLEEERKKKAAAKGKPQQKP
jgi:hypothetical protein